MAPRTINVLLSSFPGLGLPNTLALPVTSSASVSELHAILSERIPAIRLQNRQLILTTTSNKQLDSHSDVQVQDLLSERTDDFLGFRLSARLCGGKGGFGSQLRAAGGRMSSKKKKNQGDSNGSSRNLDGRRLRTVTEAKALAEYLAIKPDMEKKEKELRRKRWEQVVELAEKREEDLKSGARGTIDGKWAEDKEEAGERTREAVRFAMQSGAYNDSFATACSSSNPPLISEDAKSATSSSTSIADEPETVSPGKALQKPRSFAGFDEDDEFLSDESDDSNDASS